MDKMIVVVFEHEPPVYAAFHALKQLHSEGSISLFSSVVANRQLNGMVTARQIGNPTWLPPSLSLATNELVAALGATGARPVSAADALRRASAIANLGVSEEFLSEILLQLRPGKWALIAEIEEDWVTPLDTVMELLGGRVLRRARAELSDAQLEREASILRDEAAQLRYEMSRVEGSAKARLQAKADAAISRLETARDGVRERVRAMTLEAEEKIRRMQAQAASVAGDERLNIERRIFDVQTDYQRRLIRIGRAWQITAEGPTH